MKQTFISGIATDLGHELTGTEYNVWHGGKHPWTVLEDQNAQVVSAHGQIRLLKVLCVAGPPGANWATFTLMVNGVPSALTCTMTGLGIFTTEDSVHSVTVAPGDYISLRGTYGAGLLQRFQWSAVFTGDIVDESIILGCSNQTPLHLNARWSELLGYGNHDAIEANVWQIIPLKGTVKHLYARCTPFGAGVYSYRSTLRVNGADTALTCIVTSPATDSSNTINEVPVNTGDRVTLQGQGFGAPTVACNHNYGMIFVPDQVTDPKAGAFTLGGTDDMLSIVATRYHRLSGVHGGVFDGWDVTEAGRRQLGQVCGLRNLFVRLNGAPGIGTSYTFTIWVNGMPTAITCTIADANVAANDITHEVIMSDWDYVSLECVPAGPPAARHAHWGIGLTHGLPTVTTDAATGVF